MELHYNVRAERILGNAKQYAGTCMCSTKQMEPDQVHALNSLIHQAPTFASYEVAILIISIMDT